MSTRGRPRTGGRVRLLALTALLAASALSLGCGDNRADGRLPDARPPGEVTTVAAAATVTSTATQHHDFALEGLERVGVADARFAFDAGVATFLDVRDVMSYQAAHIPGAVSIPLEELDARVAELDRGRIIITYCT